MKRFILLLWLLLVANPGSAWALKPSVAESRVCQSSFLPLAVADPRPAVDRKQSPCLRRVHGGCIYDGGLKLIDFRGLRPCLHAYDGPGISGGSSMGEPAKQDPFGSDQGDTELDKVYLRARWYRSTRGLFATLDPFAGNQSDPLSLHKYLYCHGNPKNGTDPSGHMTLAELQVNVAAWGFITVNTLHRVAPVANRVTIALYEGISGSTVVGGAGLLAGSKVTVTVVGGATRIMDPLAKAATERIALQGFKEAGKYGVWPFKVLRWLVPNFSGLQKQHLVEERLATALGVKADDIPAIALTQAEHSVFTATWRRLIAYQGSVSNPLTTNRSTPEAIWKAAQEVYAEHPELLEFVKTFLNIP